MKEKNICSHAIPELAIRAFKKLVHWYIRGWPTRCGMLAFSNADAEGWHLHDIKGSDKYRLSMKLNFTAFPSSSTKCDFPVPVDCRIEMQRPECRSEL
jgi:hypothetical protein